MLIDGIAVGGYRSFRDIQRFSPLAKVNILAGQNNCGKSNLLRFLNGSLNLILSATPQNLELRQNPFGANDISKWPTPSESVQVGIGVRPGSELHRAMRERACGPNLSPPQQERNGRHFDRAISALMGEGDVAWFDYDLKKGRVLLTSVSLNSIQGSSEDREWSSFWSSHTQSSGGGMRHWVDNSFSFLAPLGIARIPTVTMIPAIRQVVSDGRPHALTDFSGLNLIQGIARLQSPPSSELQLSEQFDRLNRFVAHVLDIPDARLIVTYDLSELLVSLEGATLPLEDLGTGIQQVVILAAAATLLEDQVVAIEEPEQHLHPMLQRKLLAYLSNETNNTYFITTHSAHLLDAATDASVFHLTRRGLVTTAKLVESHRSRAAICADLGYRPSDLVQANAIIWVEGPSDRILIKHWIAALNPDLVEGSDYSIMFYGGRLLSHLAATDPDVEEFISLRRLNRHITVVIDSDRDGARSKLNATKSRIVKEFEHGPGFAWVTAGREIENYIERSVLEAAIGAVAGNGAQPVDVGRYNHAFHYNDPRGSLRTDIDKVALARAVAKQEANLDPFDLRQMMQKLVAFIHEANGFPVDALAARSSRSVSRPKRSETP